MEKFENIPGGNPFKVPENYFEEVKRKISSSASGINPQERQLSKYSRLRHFTAIAASISLLCLLSFFGTTYFTHRNETSFMRKLTFEELNATLLNDVDILTLEEIVKPEGTPTMGYHEESNDLIDYLMLENIDVTELEVHLLK